MKLIGAAIAGLVAASAACALSAADRTGAVIDPSGVLSAETTVKVGEAASAFERLTGRRMVVVVLSEGKISGLDSLESLTRDLPVLQTSLANIGLVYATSPDDPAGRLFIVDPVWRTSLPSQWSFMFPQRLAQKFAEEPFERRVVLSARYLAKVFPDKLAFVLKPRGGTLSEGSLKFSRASFIGIEILGYFIIFLTAFRTFWPARLRDEDQDDFSNELRRLKKERQIW